MISMDINIVLPEITLAVFAMAALMVAVYGGKDRLAGLMFWSTSGIMGLSQDYLEKNKLFKFEFPILIALAALGMMLMVSAGDLMALYMGLELQSLALYVVASFRRDSIRSTEAGLKYFVLGALSSGLLLYGASLVYGFSGTTNFAGISETINGTISYVDTRCL